MRDRKISNALLIVHRSSFDGSENKRDVISIQIDDRIVEIDFIHGIDNRFYEIDR